MVNTVSEEFKTKWTPAVVDYARILRSKSAKEAVKAAETKFIGTIRRL